MKDIYKEEDFEIPDGVSLSVKSRLVTVKGPRGELTKNLRHINMEIKKISDKKIKLVVWHGARKHVACLRTVRSLITNMIQGVTKVCFRWNLHFIVMLFLWLFDVWQSLHIHPLIYSHLYKYCIFTWQTVFSCMVANIPLGLPLQNALRLRPFPHQRQRHRVTPLTLLQPVHV